MFELTSIDYSIVSFKVELVVRCVNEAGYRVRYFYQTHNLSKILFLNLKKKNETSKSDQNKNTTHILKLVFFNENMLVLKLVEFFNENICLFCE